MTASTIGPSLGLNVDLWGAKGAVPTRVHQRCVAIADWECEHPDWRAYDHGHSLAVSWDWAPGPRGRASTRLDIDPPLAGGPGPVFLHVTDPIRAYEGLEPEAVTLTFLAGLNGLLAGVADRLDIPRPTPLPPTRRERRWLEAGNQLPAAAAAFTQPLIDRRKEISALPFADFWAVMDALTGDAWQRERRLRGLLRKRTLPDLAAFHAAFVVATSALYTKEMWAAADQVIGEASDDVFTDLRCWVVAQGQAAFDAVRADPARLHETLDGVDPEEISGGEVLAAVAEELYLDRSGRTIAADYLGIEGHEPSTAPT